jgi:hypothetical protein
VASELSFTVPAEVSFEQASALTQELLARPEGPADRLEMAIAALVRTTAGARGFFVVFLTGDSPLADAPSAAVLRGLATAPEIVADLLVKNLAMSAAMELSHHRQGHPELAQESAQVQRRTRQLIHQLQLPALEARLQQLQTSLTTPTGAYQDFLERWGYDAPQRSAIQRALGLAAMTRDEATQLLRRFTCLDSLAPDQIPDHASIREALMIVADQSDYQILGICADHLEQGKAVLNSYIQALGYQFVPDVPVVAGAVYIKYNPKLRRCHSDVYRGSHRGVLVSCQSADEADVNETFGHLPLNLFLLPTSSLSPE